jgi:hypothetical protein
MRATCPHCRFEFNTEQRTIPMNSLYWNVLNFLAEHWGESRDRIHEYFKDMFLSEEIEVLGKKVRRVRSTANLDKKTFSVFEGHRFFRA